MLRTWPTQIMKRTPDDISIFFERPKKGFEQMMAAIQTAKDMRPRWRSACAVVNMVLTKRLAEEMILTRTDEQKN